MIPSGGSDDDDNAFFSSSSFSCVSSSSLLLLQLTPLGSSRVTSSLYLYVCIPSVLQRRKQ